MANPGNGPDRRPSVAPRDGRPSDGTAAPPSRVLFVSGARLVPAKLGPARRNHHLIDQLCRFYDVSVLSLGTPACASIFAATLPHSVTRARFVAAACPRTVSFIYKLWQTARGRCDFLPALAPELHKGCAALTSRHRFDAVILSSALLRRLPLPAGVPVISDAHNVEFDVLRRMAVTADSLCRRQYARRQRTITEREERENAQSVELMLAASERDRELFRHHLQVAAVEVVPNGIDVSEFRPVPTTGRAPVIVFTGLLSYYPNQHAVRWFLNEVFPQVLRRVPTARLVIGGAAPPRWLKAKQHDVHVEITGEVPDMRPILARAAVVVAPLHIGGGTRVKILEALAMAKPVVSTSIGAEGLGLEHGQSILIGDDAESFAAHVVSLLVDAERGAHLAARGRRQVLQRFDWDQIGDHLQQLLAARFGLVARQQVAGLNDIGVA